MTRSVESHHVVISFKDVIEDIYGPPMSSLQGKRNIAAFLAKKINKPATLKRKRISIPVDEQNYQIDFSGYETVNEPRDVNGRIAFRAVRGKREFIVTGNGEIVGRAYNAVEDPQNINGRIVFHAELNNKQFLVTEKGWKV
jgi:hypothetical protein